MKQYLITIVILSVVLVLLAGCGSGAGTPTPTTTIPPASPTAAKTPATTPPTSAPAKPISTTPAAGAPKYGGTLRLIYDAAPSGSIGYPQGLMGDATFAPQLCFEAFLKEDNKGEFTPWLAESYKVADDQKSITFILRKGVKFHDGSELNAQTAKWNLENTIAAKQAPYWASVETLDDYTVRINFSKWQNTMMSGFAGGSTWMVSKTAFDKNGLDWIKQNPVGTGPFKFVSYLKDTSFKTVKHTEYWRKDAQGNQLPYLDGVTILFITDNQTQINTMQAGEADLLTIKPGKVAADMAAAGFLVKSAEIDTSILCPDTLNADSPWANPKVREAVDYSIDREGLAKGMGYGYWKPAYQLPGSDLPAYDPNFAYVRKYDVEKAKKLLADAGYPSGFKTTIIACPFNLNRDVPVAVQGYLAKIGIQADVQYPDPGKFTTDYMMGQWKNAVVYEPIAGFANYMTIFTIMYNPITNYHPSWQRTPEYLEAYDKALATPKADITLIRALTNTISKNSTMIPVNEGGRGWANKPYVMDYGMGETSLPSLLRFEKAWLNK